MCVLARFLMRTLIVKHKNEGATGLASAISHVCDTCESLAKPVAPNPNTHS